MLNFGGVTSLETTCPSDPSSSNASKPEKDLKPSNISPPSVGLASQLLSCPKLQIMPLIWLNPELPQKRVKISLGWQNIRVLTVVTAKKKKTSFVTVIDSFVPWLLTKNLNSERLRAFRCSFRVSPLTVRHLSAKISRATSNATTSMVRCPEKFQQTVGRSRKIEALK